MYSLIRIWLQIALKFYCRNVSLRTAQGHVHNAPAIITANHPNSFFDALIIAAYYPEKIYFLARGDAFNKKWAAWILRRLNLIPIHRLEEGRENLTQNEHSFAECMQVFKDGGTVLIFPEGLSKHELQLRPLRKGAARLAYLAWEHNGIDKLTVQPLQLSYNSFVAVPKSINLSYETSLAKQDFDLKQEAIFYNQFNEILKTKLENNTPVFVKPERPNSFKKALLAIPAFAGYITQRWFYIFFRNLAAKKTSGTVFYDSVLFASMMLIYPIFVLLISALTVHFTGNCIWWLLFLIMPFTAWSYKEYKSL